MTTRLFGGAGALPVDACGLHRTRWDSVALVAVMVIIFGVAAGLVFYYLSIGHALYGLTEYDDGVYFGATMHFVAGQLPYRDFVMVQPPGITLLMAPIALFVGHNASREGLAIARVVTGIVEGANAVLVVWILRHKGLLAAFVGGLLFAIYPTAFDSDHTLMLEPYMALFCLLAVAVAFRNGELASNRRLFIAGILVGVAGTIKLFAVAIAIAFVIAIAWRKRSALVPFISGLVIGFVVPCLAFFIGSPHGFIADIFTSQLSRNTAKPTPIVERISAAVGISLSTSPLTLAQGPDSPWPILAGGLLAGITFFGVVVPGFIKRAPTFTWFALFGALTSFGIVLIPQQFYTHYAYLAGLFFSIMLACVVANMTTLARSLQRRLARSRSARSRSRRSVGLGLAGALTALVVIAGSAFVLHSETKYLTEKTMHYGDPIGSLDATIPAGSCVISDVEILLVISNRMDVSPNCPIMDDATGTWLTYAPKYPPQRNAKEPKDPALVALWKRLLSHNVQYAVFAGNKAFRTPFTPALSAWFNDNFVRVVGAAPITFVRRPHPIVNAPSYPGIIP